MMPPRARLMRAAIAFLQLNAPAEAMPLALLTLHHWLDSWIGIGLIERGMARQGYGLSYEGWRECLMSRAASTPPPRPPARCGSLHHGGPCTAPPGKRCSGWKRPRSACPFATRRTLDACRTQHFQSIALREHEVEEDAIEGLVVHEEEPFLA